MADETDLSQYFAALGAPEPIATPTDEIQVGDPYTQYGPVNTEILGLSRNYLSGMTLGQWPKIEAAAAAPFSDRTYGDILKDIRIQQQIYGQEHPVLSLGTEIVPSLVTNPLGVVGALGKGATIAGAMKTLPTVAKYVEATPELLTAARAVAPVVSGIEKGIEVVPGGIIATKLLSTVPAQAAIESALRAEEGQSPLAEAGKGLVYGSAGSAVSNLAGRAFAGVANEADRLRLSAFKLNSQDVQRNIKKAEQIGVEIKEATDVPILQTIKRLQKGTIIDPEAEILQNITSVVNYQDDLAVELNSRLRNASEVITPSPEFTSTHADRFTKSLSGKARDQAEKLIAEEREAIVRQMQGGGTINDLQNAKTGLNYVWDAKPYSEDVRKAIRADLRQEIEDRLAYAETKGKLPQGVASEVKDINREWGAAADLKDVFARKAGKDLGEDVVEGLFGQIRTSGGTGSLNIISSVTGSPLFAVAGAGLNAMRASAGKNFLADVLEDPLAKKIVTKAGEALQEVGQGRAFAISGSRVEQQRNAAAKKDEAVKDSIIQGLRGLSATSKPEDIKKALEGFKRKAKSIETPTATPAPELGKVSYAPADVKAAILAEDSLTQAMVSAESKGDPRAKSKAGAEGLLQLMPATAKELGVTDATDYRQSLKYGKKYFRQMLAKFDGDRKIALAAYNWGPDRVETALRRIKSKGFAETWENLQRYSSVPAETEGYVRYILREEGKIRNNPTAYWDQIFNRREKRGKV